MICGNGGWNGSLPPREGGKAIRDLEIGDRKEAVYDDYEFCTLFLEALQIICTSLIQGTIMSLAAFTKLFLSSMSYLHSRERCAGLVEVITGTFWEPFFKHLFRSSWTFLIVPVA
ncbi:hypothetical protein MKW98_029720 [Papaver atlanticum]|uniref:Uncharacterized protein n=1 Tax=Papaver atlanticum TaxID=357466 RepID=A0AAD4T4E4_9MAGN|nr:hypothetical protein MKW98_029720 [Papaver atlanticum]